MRPVGALLAGGQARLRHVVASHGAQHDRMRGLTEPVCHLVQGGGAYVGALAWAKPGTTFSSE